MVIIHKLDPTIKHTEKNVPAVGRSKYWYIWPVGTCMNARVKPMSDDLIRPSQIPEELKGYFNRGGFIYHAPDVNF